MRVALRGADYLTAWRCLPDGEERRRPGEADRQEGQPAVARQAERETGKRRADEDHEHGGAVHEADGCRGSVGADPQRHVEDGGERESGREADSQGSERRNPERQSGGEHERARRAHDQADGDELPGAAAVAAHDEPTGGPGDDAGEEDEPADHAGDAAAVTLVLEQGHDPVSGHDREPEGRDLHRGERPEPAVADHSLPPAPAGSSGWSGTPVCLAARTGSTPRRARTRPVQYGARQPRLPTSCGTTISASPPAAIVEPP